MSVEKQLCSFGHGLQESELQCSAIEDLWYALATYRIAVVEGIKSQYTYACMTVAQVFIELLWSFEFDWGKQTSMLVSHLEATVDNHCTLHTRTICKTKLYSFCHFDQNCTACSL